MKIRNPVAYFSDEYMSPRYFNEIEGKSVKKMIEIGVQTKNIVNDYYPEKGFAMLGCAGFTCADFSLNGYLSNTSLYRFELNSFFDQSVTELERFFTPHKKAAGSAGIQINQMHMPYPSYIPNAPKPVNDYLMHTVTPKSLKICAFFGLQAYRDARV